MQPPDEDGRNRHPVRGRRGRGDAGAAASLAAALLAPVFVVLAFAAVQAALWGHARTEARVVARDTAALVARSDVDPGDAAESARAALVDTDLAGVEVAVTTDGDLVSVTIRGDAPGIVIGTSRRVTVTEAVPIEEITP